MLLSCPSDSTLDFIIRRIKVLFLLTNFTIPNPWDSLFPLQILPICRPRTTSIVVIKSKIMGSLSPSEPSRLLPPLPDKRIVVGCGGLGMDYLAIVDDFPKPDDKIRSIRFLVQGGGNAGNALTGASRLGLIPRLISKVANDAQGRTLLAELKDEGVDTSYIVVSEEGNSPFSYIIVDNQTRTRTCIFTPGCSMLPDDLSHSSLFSALDGARIFYSDGRSLDTTIVIAKEAAQMKIPILVDAEKKRKGLDDLLNLASYLVCPEKFPRAWTAAPSIPMAMLSMLLRFPNLKFVIVTLGENGCIMLERNINGDINSEETDIDNLLESLKQRIDDDKPFPTCVSSKPMVRLTVGGIGSVSGRLLVGTSEMIPPSELIDTTGAGDAFVGAILYAICADMPPEKMLPFAAHVAATGIRGLGARTGLPRHTDPHLAPFLC